MQRLLSVSVPLLLIVVALHGQEPTEVPEHLIDIALTECLSIDSNMSTHGMMDCVQLAQDAWDHEMNRVYKELMESLDSAGQNALREAQRAWLKYRHAEIELCSSIYYGNLDGTMYYVMAADRVMRIVKARALELVAYLDNLSQ